MSRPLPGAARGVSTRPVDTLLVERARDYLAAGPATSAALVASVCQIPGLPEPIAERVAVELLSRFDDFRQEGDGRWTLAAVAPAREVGRPPDPPPRVPSFEEWQAARQAGRLPDAPPRRAAARSEAHDRQLTPAAPPEDRWDDEPAGPDDGQSLADLSYVVVDVETTGGTPTRGHRITEIAAVVVRGGEVRDVYETLVNPERPIPPEIMRLTGITAEMVRDKPRFHDVCNDVVDVLAGHVFVAHNVGFDWRFVSAEVERATGRRLDGPRLCTVRLSRKLLPQLRSRSLGHVADFYGADTFAQSYFEARHGRERPWRHSAAGDAVATAHCLLRLLKDAADRGVTRWGELDMWLAGGTGRARRRRRSALPSSVHKDTTA
jgi:DNA polymerase-3 subunit epsilon